MHYKTMLMHHGGVFPLVYYNSDIRSITLDKIVPIYPNLFINLNQNTHKKS